MSEDIKALIRFKCKDLPLTIQQYLVAIFPQIVGLKFQGNISIDRVDSILGFVEFSFEVGEIGGYIMGIKYTPSSSPVDSFPIWKVVLTENNVTQEVKQIDEILEWILEYHFKATIQSERPGYFSRCQEKQVVLTELNGQTISIPVRDIIYFSAEGDFTRIFHGHGHELKSNMVDLSMLSAESMMKPFCFYRIHRSYMVNLGCIRHIHTTNSLVSVVLCSGDELPVARRRKTALIESFNTFSISN